MSFVAFAAVAGFLAYFYRADSTWLQVWIGVGLTFLTAGVVDGVALADSNQRQREAAARMAPLREIIREKLHRQQENFVALGSLLLGEDPGSDLSDHPERVRALPDRRFTFTDTDGMPGGPLYEMRQQQLRLLSAQKDLEQLAAAEYQTEQIAGLSRLIRGGNLMPFVAEVLETNSGSWTACTGYARNGELRHMVADALEELRGIGIP